MRTIYENAINLLWTSNAPLNFQVVRRMMPHLKDAEIKAVLAKVKRGTDIYHIALPPVLVDGIVLVACIHPRRGPQAAYMRLSHTVKLPHTAKFAKRALYFARKHWGDKLLKDTWAEQCMEMYVQDPSKLNVDQPTNSHVLTIVLSRNMGELYQQRHAPRSVVINDHILHVTTNPAHAAELTCSRNPTPYFNCARCSSGLGLTECACGCKFGKSEFRSGWPTPLPEKVVAYLANLGHKFAFDPKIARQIERGQWKHDVADGQFVVAKQEREELEASLAKVHERTQEAYRLKSAGSTETDAAVKVFTAAVETHKKATAEAAETERQQVRQKRKEARERRKQAQQSQPAKKKTAKRTKPAKKGA